MIAAKSGHPVQPIYFARTPAARPSSWITA